LRDLGVPTIGGRVAQAAAKLVREPIFLVPLLQLRDAAVVH